MRREINILWVEDNLNATVRDLQNEVREIISKSLYEVNIYNSSVMQCINFKSGRCNSCANKVGCNRSILRDNRIDLIFSDNNLDNGGEGVDFLTDYRKKGEYKYYILYSNLDESAIVGKIIDRLKTNMKIHLFSNFDFLSLNNWEERIDDSIAAFINNRSKMEELSNIYIVENSIIEDKLKEINISGTYFDQINSYCTAKNVERSIKDLWHKVRKDRNILAHGTISFRHGFNIATLEDKSISEEKYDEKIENLKILTDALVRYGLNLV